MSYSGLGGVRRASMCAMELDPADDLAHAIDWYCEVIPTSARRPYGPPRKPAAVDAVLAAIDAERAGYTLPSEIVAFWRAWDPFGFDVVPWPRLDTPTEALELWNQDLETGLPRSLFPIAYESHGHLFVELIRAEGGPAPIWYYAFCDEVIECRYPSLASLFRACAEVVEVAGVAAPERDEDRHATYGDLVDSRQLTAIVDRHFAMSPHAERIAVPSHDISGWPTSWRLAEGIDDDYMLVRGRTHTVAQFVDAAQNGPVEARLHGRWATLGGMDDVGFGELTDDTGTVALVVPLAVPHVGGSDGGVEVDVAATRPFTDRLDFDSSSVQGAIAAGDYDLASQLAGAAAEALQGALNDLPRVHRMVPLA